MRQLSSWCSYAAAPLLLLLAACSAPEPTERDTRPVDIAKRIAWTTLEAAEAQTLVTLPAEVVSAPNRTALLSAPFDGRLDRWLVAVGGTVEIGTPLAAIESLALDDLAATQDQLATVLRARQQGLALAKKQLDAGFATSDTVQQQRMAVAEARAQLDEVRRRQASRRALLGAGREEDGATWIWRSPMRGIIGELRCGAGTQVRTDVDCIGISDPRGALVRVYVPQRLLAALGTAKPRLVFHQEGQAERQLDWIRQHPEIDAESRSLAMYFGGAGLLPGATGRGDLVTTAAAGVLSVPRSALTRIDGQDVVFIDPVDTPTPTPVRIIGRHGDFALVQGDDVAAGRQVVSGGVFLLKSMHLLETPL